MWNSLLSWKQSLKLHFIYEQLRKKLLEKIELAYLNTLSGLTAVSQSYWISTWISLPSIMAAFILTLKFTSISSSENSVQRTLLLTNSLFCRTSVFSIKTNHSAGDLFLGLWPVPQCLAYRRCSVNARWLLFLLLFIHSAQSPLLSMP